MGQRIMDGLRGALELLRGGVPEAARDGLVALRNELGRLQAGKSLISPLPASYQREGELWLPVRAEALHVRLQAPDLRPRPPAEPAKEKGNLPAKAQRVTWLPVGLSLRRINQLFPLLGAGASGLSEGQRLLKTLLAATQSRTRLEHRPLILAYYAVEASLSHAPRWDDQARGRLERAGDALAQEPNMSDLAASMRTQAKRSSLNAPKLQALANRLRRRIVKLAGEQ
jgi:hypothetical protein